MLDELQDRAADAVAKAKRAGAADALAAATRSRSVSFRVRDGELEEVTDSTSRGLSLRLFVDGRYSSHATTDLRPASVEDFVREAVALTRALQPDEYRTMPDPELFAREPARLDLEDGAVDGLDREKRLAWCHAMDQRLTGKDKVISATSGVFDGSSRVAAATSNGFTGSYATTRVGVYATVTLDEGERRPEASSSAQVRHLKELPGPDGVADEALELARLRLGSEKGPSEKTVMVVDPRAAGSLVGRFLGPAQGRSVQQQRSFWAGRLGEKVVSDKLTVTDDPLIPRGLASRPFDGEGYAGRRLPLVSAGVLENYYLDTYYANKLKRTPTTGDGSNRVVALGERDRDALLAAVGKGILVTSWLGGNMDSTTGDFSYGVRGHLIEGGKLGTPVGEMNVTGNMVELFAALAEVGNDPWPYSSTLAPTLVFEDVEFSGA